MSRFSSDDLYIVADGHHFIFLAKDDKRQADHLIAFKKFKYDSKKYISDIPEKPGRIFDRTGVARSSYVFSDVAKKSDLNYLKEACKQIDSEFKRGNFSRIILVGDSEILAMIKKGMSKNMLSKVFREVYKNYSKLPVEELERHLNS